MAIHFTKQQIDEIEQALIARSKKDSSFPGVDTLDGTELIPVIQGGVNKITTYSGLWNAVSKDLRQYVENALDSKVDVEEGKQLSTEDYTTEDKSKLSHIEAGAQVNVNADWNATTGDAFIVNKPDLSVYATKASLQDVTALIPNQASASNQLADKSFVNSTVATNTAEFKGTYNTLSELETVAANKNDYGFVITVDSVGNTQYDRYKYNGTTWLYEYSLNNSSFTAAQWAAIQSGITAELVAQFSNYPSQMADGYISRLNNDLNILGKKRFRNAVELYGLNETYPLSLACAANAIYPVGYVLPVGIEFVNSLDNRVLGRLKINEVDGSFYRKNSGNYEYKIYDEENFNTFGDSRYLQLAGGAMSNTNAVTNLNADMLDGKHNGEVSAAKLETAIDISISDAGNAHTGTAISFDGSEDVTLPLPNTINAQVARNTEISRSEEFNYQSVPVKHFNDAYKIDRIYGKTLAWNQMVQNGNFTSTSGWQTYLSNFTVSNNTATVVSNSAGGCIYKDITIVAGHKYFCSASAKSDGTSLFRVRCEGAASANFLNVTSSSFVYGSVIVTAGSSQTYIRIAAGNPNVAATGYVRDIILIDLTLMFGAGNEPSTVAEFESMFPGYHPYSAGKLISNDAESIETVGFNQWDEEWESGSFDTSGNPVAAAGLIRCKNYIPALPDTDYYLREPAANNHVLRFALCYDANKNFLDYTSYTSDSHGYIIHTVAKTAYLKFGLTASYGSTYNHDICINLSDPAKNETYEPYRKSVMQLGLGSFQVRDSQGNVTTITGGLKSAGDAKDEIVGNKYIKRVGRVDLGTLNWVYEESSYMRSSDIDNFKPYYYSTGVNMINAKYIIYPNTVANMPDKSMRYYSDDSPNILIKDSAYTDAAAFKAVMSGVMLYYELATPVEYELVESIMNCGWINENGTMRVIHEDETEPHVMFKADFTYGVNAGDIVDKAHQVLKSFKDKIETLWDAVFNQSNE